MKYIFSEKTVVLLNHLIALFTKMSKRYRQYFGILMALLAYYLVHEGAHFLYALSQGVFRTIRFMGVGVQIDIYAERLTDHQLGIFCLVGAVATLLVAWLLILMLRHIVRCRSKVVLAAVYYITMAMLFLDPLYLSLLCDLFGGGDMNGIRLLLPEIPVRIAFALLFMAHALLFARYVLPRYKAAFNGLDQTDNRMN